MYSEALIKMISAPTTVNKNTLNKLLEELPLWRLLVDRIFQEKKLKHTHSQLILLEQ